MGFIGWLRKLAGGAVSKVEDVVRLVRTGLAGLWHVLGNLGGTVGKAWHRFTDAVSWLSQWLEQIAQEVAVKLRHVYRVLVPAAIRHAISTAAAFAQRLANTVAHAAAQALAAVRDALVRAVNAVRSWAQDAVRWLTQHLADVVNDLGKVKRLVGNLLDDPAHLAEWAAGAMVSAMARWAMRNAVRLGRWFAANAAHAALDEVPTIEDWIAKIL